MKVIARQPAYDESGNIILKTIDRHKIQVNEPALLSIDGSTTNTGISILRVSDKALFYSLAVTREKNTDETPVKYKVRLKRLILDILLTNPAIQWIFYEEPFIGYAEAAANLLMLRTSIEELIVENEPTLDYIKHYELHNKTWKKRWLAPDKCPTGTEAEKLAIKNKLLKYMPYMSVVTQDEMDAYSMGFVASQVLAESEEETLKKKKTKPFKYNIEFVGAYDDVGFGEVLMDVYNGPRSILDEGITLVDLDTRAKFEKSIYEFMGDNDKLLVLKFSSDTHSDVVLQHRIGNLSASFPYIYAIVWRMTRKKKSTISSGNF